MKRTIISAFVAGLLIGPANVSGAPPKSLFGPPKSSEPKSVPCVMRKPEVEVYLIDITGSVPSWVPPQALHAAQRTVSAEAGNEPLTVYVRSISSNSTRPESNAAKLSLPGICVPQPLRLSPMANTTERNHAAALLKTAQRQHDQKIQGIRAMARQRVAGWSNLKIPGDPNGTDTLGGVGIAQLLFSPVSGEKELFVVSDFENNEPSQDGRSINNLHSVSAQLFQVCETEQVSHCRKVADDYTSVLKGAGATVHLFDVTQLNTISAET